VLAAIDGIDEAYIYGSWAARYRGELDASGAVHNPNAPM